MKKDTLIRHLLKIIFILLPYSLANGQGSANKDMFPLSRHLKYTYSFQQDTTLYDMIVAPVYSVSDSGLVSYTILDSVKTSDSTLTWYVKEIRQLVHKVVAKYPELGRDTIYSILDTSVVLLAEYTYGQHELACSSQIWSFPLIDSLTSIFRYQDHSPFVLAHSAPFFYWGPDTLIFSEGFGLTRRFIHKWLNSSSSNPLYYNANISLLEIVTNVRESLSQLPQQISLEQNYPNPFNPNTRIRYTLPSREHIILAVYDILGRMVDIIFEGQHEKGSHEVMFKPNGLASGIYFYKLKSENSIITRKMLLLK
jgi:hypothetical protein